LTGSGAKLLRAADLPVASPQATSSLLRTLPALDAIFSGGLPDRRLIELVGRRSAGRFSIALAALACATARGDAAALVDLGDHLDPQAAQAAGVDLSRLLWVRPRRVKDALAAAEILVSTGFRLILAEMGLAPRGAAGRGAVEGIAARRVAPSSAATPRSAATRELLCPCARLSPCAGPVVSCRSFLWRRGCAASPT